MSFFKYVAILYCVFTAFLKEYLDRRKYVMTTQIGIEIAPEISGCISKNSTIKEIITRFKIKVPR